MVEAAGVPRLGDHLRVGELFRQLDAPDDGRELHRRAVAAASEHRPLVEAEAVDVHLLDPVVQAVDDELLDDRVVRVDRVAAPGVVHVVLPLGRVDQVVGVVAEALEADRRAHVVALARVVEDDVEDHLDPGLVERLHHVAELGDLRALLRAHAVARLRREVAVRVVAPVVAKLGAVDRVDPAHLALVESEHRQQLDRGDAEVLQVGDLLDDPRERAGMLDARALRAREAADVHLVDDRVAHRSVQRLVAFPVVRARVDDHSAHRGGEVVAGPARLDRLPQRVRVALRVRVEQHLLGVEPLAGVVFRPVDPERVVVAGAEAADVHVPEMEAPVPDRVERDRRDRLLVVVRIEQEQLDARRVAGEDGEVDSAVVDRRAERHRRSLLERRQLISCRAAAGSSRPRSLG